MSRAVSAAVFLLALCVSLPAQRGGMRGGGGGMRGGGGGARMTMGRAPASMGFARAPQVRPQFFAPRSAAFARPRPAFVGPRSTFVPRQRGFFTTGSHTNRPFIFTPGFSGRFGHHFHNHAFFYALPYYYGAYWPSYYDDYWDNPYYSFGSYSYDPTANTSSYSDLSNQMSQLSSEVQQLRDENDSLRSSLYEQQRPPVAPAQAATTIGTTSGNEPPTVLVYRDGHRSEIQNYAIVGSTLWALSANRATKVPLADLNIDQTIQLNEDRGISFQVPKK